MLIVYGSRDFSSLRRVVSNLAHKAARAMSPHTLNLHRRGSERASSEEGVITGTGRQYSGHVCAALSFVVFLS